MKIFKTFRFKILNIIFCSLLTILFIISILWSKSYWGYYFKKPPIPGNFKTINNVTTLIHYTIDKQNKLYNVNIDTCYSLKEDLEFCHKYPCECYSGRILLLFEDHNIIPVSYTRRDSIEIKVLWQLLDKINMPQKDISKEDTRQMIFTGLFTSFKSNKNEYCFLSLRSWVSVSNDHYQYYEYLFSKNTDENEFTLFNSNQFFIDVAGIECIEWYTIFIMGSILIIVLYIFSIIVLTVVFRKKINYKQSS